MSKTCFLPSFGVACLLLMAFGSVVHLLPFRQHRFSTRAPQASFIKAGLKGPLPPSADITLTASGVQMTPPFNECNKDEETAQVPVKEQNAGKQQQFVNMCVQPYATSCVFPGSYVAFTETCSLQCQCIKQATEPDYKYADCRSICTSPPHGLRCFSQPEPGNCCPTYTDCLVVDSSFKAAWVQNETAYHSRSFRCMGQEVLDNASCLMLVREAIPTQVFTTRFRATCTCMATDTFKIEMFNSQQHNNVKALENPQKFILVKSNDKIRKEKFQ